MVFSKFPRCRLHAARCPLHAACCLASGACCLLRDACRLLFAACCPLHAACCLEVVCCTLRVVRCIFPVSCWMSSVTFSPMHVACCQWSVAHFRVVVCGIAVRWIVSACPFFVARRTFSVACCLLACPSVPCRMACVVCRLARVASRCLSHLACRLSHAVCGPLQSDTAPSHTQRIAAALALERLSGRRAPLHTEVCVRVRVRACLRVGSERDGVFVGCCACVGRIRARAIE
jgi:hypothetical protein